MAIYARFHNLSLEEEGSGALEYIDVMRGKGRQFSFCCMNGMKTARFIREELFPLDSELKEILQPFTFGF